MSLRAILECAVHIDQFRNIDLFQQGLYQLRISVSQVLDHQKFPAQPYDLKLLAPPRSRKPSFDSHNVTPSCLLERELEYCSNGFLVKYCDEEVRIGDICVFRAEVYAGAQYMGSGLDVEARLMFYKAGGSVPMERYKSMDVELEGFEEASKAKVTVRNPCLGVHQYCPLLFDDMHFCTVNLVIHTALLDYRFRPTPMLTPQQELSTRSTELDDSAVNLEMTLAQYLFPGSQGEQLKPEEADRVYYFYVSLLEKSSQELRELIWKLKQSLSTFELELLGPEEGSEADPSLSPAKITKISQILPGGNAEEITTRIMADAHSISMEMYPMYHHLLQLCQTNPQLCISHFKSEFLSRVRERFGECIFRDQHPVEALPLQSNEELPSLHVSICKSRRGNAYFQSLEPLPLEDTRMIGKAETLPILFEDSYIPVQLKAEEALVNREGITLFVLVHGFQGNSFDMRLFKNHIGMIYPNYMYLCSAANEGNTEGDIIEMGLRLSNEVKSYLQDWCPSGNIGSISFIGHSLGGLIIRAALPFLSEYSDKMKLYMTLSTPHLGYMYSDSKLVDAGLWFLKKWRKSLCLQQLSMGDSPDPRESTLYRMSSFEGVRWFKHVVLFSSTQDQYAPFDSARLEVSSRATGDAMRGCYYIEMASKVLSQIGIEKLKRIDVNFKFTGKSVDSMIGRKAHIEFLENQALMKTVVFSYPELFSSQ